jgi:hypothetical protein
MRHAWPLLWPVTLRHAELAYPLSGRHFIREGSRGKVHVILIHPDHATGETVIHEWAHAAHVEHPTYKVPTSDPDSVQGQLDDHPKEFFALYGMIYRALIVRMGQIEDCVPPSPTERNL